MQQQKNGLSQASRQLHPQLDTQTQSLDKCITIQHQDNLKLLKMVERLLELGQWWKFNTARDNAGGWNQTAAIAMWRIPAQEQL